MLKAELRKMFTDKITLLSILILIVLYAFSSIRYHQYRQPKHYNNSLYAVHHYETIEDVKQLRHQVKAELDSLDPNDPSLSEERYDLQVLYNIYTYLIEVRLIPYDDVLFNIETGYYFFANPFSFLSHHLVLFRVLLFILLSIIVSYHLIYDFTKGTYRLVYSRPIQRSHILNVKFLSSIIISTLVATVFYFLTACHSLIYSGNTRYIMLANIDRIYVLSYFQYALLSFLPFVLFILSQVIIAFSISLILRIMLTPIIAVGLLLIIHYIFYMIGHPFLLTISNGPMECFTTHGRLVYGWGTNLIYISTIFIYYLSRTWFITRDL